MGGSELKGILVLLNYSISMLVWQLSTTASYCPWNGLPADMFCLTNLFTIVINYCYCVNVLQQITAYSHKDDNNKWIIKRASSSSLNESKHSYYIMCVKFCMYMCTYV